MAGRRTGRGGEHEQRPADFDAAEQGFRLGDPDQRGVDDRPAHGVAAGAEMSNETPKPLSEADAELEREIRAERKFTLAEAIGRMAGPGAMKGVSPVSNKR